MKGKSLNVAGIFFIYQSRLLALMGVLVADVDPDVVEIGNVPAKTVIDLFVRFTWFQHGALLVSCAWSFAGGLVVDEDNRIFRILRPPTA
jgi:hypothetical protein